MRQEKSGQERYEIKNQCIHVYDPELDLEIVAPFIPFLLPATVEEGMRLSGGAIIRVKALGESGEYEAYVEVDGAMEGQYRLFYPHGQIKGESFYTKGLLHGPSAFYSESGTLLSRSWYVNGQQQGKVKQYYASGALYSLQRYRYGILHGKQEYYYEDHLTKTLMTYLEGKLQGRVSLYYPDGHLKREIEFDNGTRCGTDRYWDEQHRLVREELCH
jgi:antitoxin component YwqK of YwqJK toxin-antitoxin module